MDSNIIAFLKTRKFWNQIITLVLIILVWGLPQFGIEIPEEMLIGVTFFLLAFASWIIRGDIRFDLATIEEARQRVDDTQKNVANITTTTPPTSE